ncbi:hypothetical protein FCH28_35285 [Streptomyces piniterrae]|uniref:Septum formation initiator n=1 Tax=Streptomyces piniterrae TaxID=2571125 RepID=A0A4U0MP03_9ACTN|nr:hypothetical protein [Streptomyces piniterrae]TJZ42276.1 hypothetical protein FCH28_35285 [Streptomyces piniterrae]
MTWRIRRIRGVATVLAWVTVMAAAAGLGAWALAGTADRHERAAPLDDAAVRRKLAAARSAAPDAPATPSAEPSPSASATPAPPETPPVAPTHPTGTGTVRVTGGSLTAACLADGRIHLTAWSPAAGFHVDDDVARGPAATATIEFEPSDDDAGDDRPYEIHCAAGHPKAVPAPDDD